MTAEMYEIKQMLSSVTLLETAQRKKIEERKRWEALATSVTTKMGFESRAPGCNRSKVEDCGVLIAQATDDIQRITRDLIAQKVLAQSVISAISDIRSQILLTDRYILGYGWVRIALDLRTSPDCARNYLHQKALRLAAEIKKIKM